MGWLCGGGEGSAQLRGVTPTLYLVEVGLWQLGLAKVSGCIIAFEQTICIHIMPSTHSRQELHKLRKREKLCILKGTICKTCFGNNFNLSQQIAIEKQAKQN